MSRNWRTTSRRRDEIAGFWPGVQLAAGLGIVAGTVTVVVFLAWLRITTFLGVFEGEETLLLIDAVWLTGLWIAISVALLVGLWLGYLAWERAAERQRQRAYLREQREAVEAAEALLDAARAQRVEPPSER